MEILKIKECFLVLEYSSQEHHDYLRGKISHPFKFEGDLSKKETTYENRSIKIFGNDRRLRKLRL